VEEMVGMGWFSDYVQEKDTQAIQLQSREKHLPHTCNKDVSLAWLLFTIGFISHHPKSMDLSAQIGYTVLHIQTMIQRKMVFVYRTKTLII